MSPTGLHIVWRSFSYCVECLYGPPYTVTTDEEDLMLRSKLHFHAMNTMLQHLLVCLGRNQHVNVLVEEKLQDYVVLLPWILPGIFQKALHICREMTKLLSVQHPVSLLTWTKAFIAKTTVDFKGFQI